jgi:hypothetical protein
LNAEKSAIVVVVASPYSVAAPLLVHCVRRRLRHDVFGIFAAEVGHVLLVDALGLEAFPRLAVLPHELGCATVVGRHNELLHILSGADRELELAALAAVEPNILDVMPPCRMRRRLEGA